MHKPKILIATIGSHGDVLPFIALGKEFLRRGHEVCVYTSPAFERQVCDEGLAFVPIGTLADYEAALCNPEIVDLTKSQQVLARVLSEAVPLLYRALSADIEPGRTIVIGSAMAFATRLIWEKLRVPTVTIHLAPSALRSSYKLARFNESKDLQNLPRWANRSIWWLIDRLFLDRLFGPGLNRHRTALGLPPVKRLFHDWIHGGDLVIGMFPAWFADLQPDRPAKLKLTNFPLYDSSCEAALPAEVKAYLAAGPAPVLFTAGTATASAYDFFTTSVEACRITGRRGILLTRFAKQIPADLPPGVVHFDYLPFSLVLPQMAAFVHHGGIGSLSQALRAGVPQLIRPMAFDQFDNALRVVNLGVARELLPRDYQPQAVEQALAELIDDGEVRKQCQKYADLLSGVQGCSLTCDTILASLKAG